MKKQSEILDKEIVYPGFFRMERYRLKHTLYAGGWSAEISRELFVRGSCVAVLLYDPHNDKVVLIEQHGNLHPCSRNQTYIDFLSFLPFKV
jgi:ADP-ribose pyrophosphatase